MDVCVCVWPGAMQGRLRRTELQMQACHDSVGPWMSQPGSECQLHCRGDSTLMCWASYPGQALVLTSSYRTCLLLLPVRACPCTLLAVCENTWSWAGPCSALLACL